MNNLLDEILETTLVEKVAHSYACNCRHCGSNGKKRNRHSDRCNCRKCIKLKQSLRPPDRILLDEILMELSSTQLTDAVEFNNKNAANIGWVDHIGKILDLLGLTWVHNDLAFAEAVADWQAKNGFSGKDVDGKIGKNTWRKMMPILGLQTSSLPSGNHSTRSTIDPSKCAFPDGSRSTQAVLNGKIYSEYLKKRSGGFHKGIDISTTGFGDAKYDPKRGTPVYATIKSLINLSALNSACVAESSGKYVQGLAIEGYGQARLEYAIVHIPQRKACGNGSEGGYGCTGDNAYGGVVGLACTYSYNKPDNTIGNFNLFIEYLHLILNNYLPYYSVGRHSYKMSQQDWIRHPNSHNIGVGPDMVHGIRISRSRLISGNTLIGYFGATTWPHVHIQAAFSTQIGRYTRNTRFDPMLMIK